MLTSVALSLRTELQAVVGEISPYEMEQLPHTSSVFVYGVHVNMTFPICRLQLSSHICLFTASHHITWTPAVSGGWFGGSSSPNTSPYPSNS